MKSSNIVLEQRRRSMGAHYFFFSVLPSFVAQQMIRDIAMEEERALGEFQPDQFHKIYIHRYEQVSILFADIKGFTGTCVHCTTLQVGQDCVKSKI